MRASAKYGSSGIGFCDASVLHGPVTNAIPAWKKLVVSALERNKRYPAAAQTRNEHGIAELVLVETSPSSAHHAVGVTTPPEHWTLIEKALRPKRHE